MSLKKKALIGAGTGAATMATVGSLFGRAALFSGAVPGIGTTAAVGLGVVGGAAGLVGAVASVLSDPSKKKKKKGWF